MSSEKGKKKRRAKTAKTEYMPKKELEEAVGAIFPDDPPLVESGKGEETKKAWKAWLKR